MAHEENKEISARQSLEMGTIYTNNPMHNGTREESTANTSLSVTDKSSLLTKIEDQNRLIRDQQSRMDSMENEMQAIRKRIDPTPAESV